MFECIADVRGWADTDCTLLLQCVLTGRAQEAYAALLGAESSVNATVKAAVLKGLRACPRGI